MVEDTPRIQTADRLTTTSIRWSTTIPASPTQSPRYETGPTCAAFLRRAAAAFAPLPASAHRMTDNRKTTPSAPFPKRPHRGRRRPRPDPASLPLAEREGRELNRTLQVEWAYRRVYRSTANGLVLWQHGSGATTPSVPTAPLEDDRDQSAVTNLMAKYMAGSRGSPQ